MSLYDLYFSNQNKKHMYMLLNRIIREEMDENIFNNIFNNTFESSDHDNLLELNKELVENICNYYNISSIDDQVEKEPVIITNVENQINYETGYISSIHKLSGNRFSYNIKNQNNIKRISKLVIPIENNDVFVNNTLKLIIPELGVDTICYCNSTNNIRNRTYGCYIPENNNVSQQSEIITISIMSLLGNDTYEDNIKINHGDEHMYTIDNTNDIVIGDILRSTKKNNYKIVDIENNNIKLNNKLQKDDTDFINVNLQNIITYLY